MFDKNDLTRVKSDIENNLGNKVTLTAKKGRKKFIVRQGTIESTFSSVFVVKLDVDDDQIPSNRRVSYNYIDILTKTVEIMLHGKDRNVADVADVV